MSDDRREACLRGLNQAFEDPSVSSDEFTERATSIKNVSIDVMVDEAETLQLVESMGRMLIPVKPSTQSDGTITVEAQIRMCRELNTLARQIDNQPEAEFGLPGM